MKKLIVAILFTLISFSVLANASETLHFLTQATYKPFEYIDKNNKIVGFDIDLARALCQKMETKCVFKNQAFDSLIPSLKFYRINAVIAGMDITSERLKQVAFIKPYMKNSALFIIKKNRFNDITDLKGKRIGMQNGSTHQKFLMDQHPEMIPVSYDTYQNAIFDLKSARLDAVFGDTKVVNEWLISNKELTALGNTIIDSNYFGIGLGIAVNKQNTTLVNKLNSALNQVQQDGTYEYIYKKWFPKG